MAELKINNQKYFSSLSTGSTLESLISAPLTAISKANAMLLSGQAQFILDYCFMKDGDSYIPITIKMEYSRNGEKAYFHLPLLTILPLNNLAVDKVDVNFNMEVTSTTTHAPSKTLLSNPAKPKILRKKARIGAKIAPPEKAKYTNNPSKNGISVSIEAKQIPLAKGITTLIDVYSKNIITSQE